MNKYDVNILEESNSCLNATFTDPLLQDPPFYCILSFNFDDIRPQFPLKYFKMQAMPYFDYDTGADYYIFCIDNDNNYWFSNGGYCSYIFEISDKQTVSETLELYQDRLEVESLKIDLILKEIEEL